MRVGGPGVIVVDPTDRRCRPRGNGNLSPDRVQPGYALTATFSSLTKETQEVRSAYYLCAYSLTNIKNGQVLWSGKYELKKIPAKGFLD